MNLIGSLMIDEGLLYLKRFDWIKTGRKQQANGLKQLPLMIQGGRGWGVGCGDYCQIKIWDDYVYLGGVGLNSEFLW